MSETEKRELIWVEKSFADVYKKVEDDKTKNDERIKIIDEYILKLSEASRNDFKANLEAMEEDAAMYTGLMLKVKQSFGKAKDEALEASYTLWEQYDQERPSIHKKISDLLITLKPLKDELKEINDMVSKVNTFDIDRFVSSVSALTNVCGRSKEMIEFLIANFGKESIK